MARSPNLEVIKGREETSQAKKRITDNLYLPLTVLIPRSVTPNHLSALRLLMFVPIIVLMLQHFYKITAALFIFAAILDGADGALARQRNQISKLGAILDPTADKVVNLAVFLGFLYYINSGINIAQQVPIWVINLLIIPIIIIDGLLFCVAFCKYMVKDILPHLTKEHWINSWIDPQSIMQAVAVKQTGANNWGKTKMVIQVIVLSALLLFDPQTSLRLHGIFAFLPSKISLLDTFSPLLGLCIIFGLLSLYGHIKVIDFKK